VNNFGYQMLGNYRVLYSKIWEKFEWGGNSQKSKLKLLKFESDLMSCYDVML
jgi:hypothetical protein